ncbi:hypothetical protein BCU70_00270 [Vibrio sp. 10N.286.49.C2]|nr:hypothetical protein BCU70_00270 [Vibrio sp. 10N.286.49.C2]PMH56994.1 hypothetical protein BCU66_05660 [Vibrio sp. 10N.286.49.B1]PMH79130.1 hypothetical protein BCU58_06510 [Vibrio sp. 10N.286.48.B7]
MWASDHKWVVLVPSALEDKSTIMMKSSSLKVAASKKGMTTFRCSSLCLDMSNEYDVRKVGDSICSYCFLCFLLVTVKNVKFDMSA